MIYFPPPQPVLNKDIRISGDVEIHPTASIAPGVILQAALGQHIAIGADVCIGMGVIINACQGSVEIESGAILGSGVLIIGACKIGTNACVGTTVTIFQANIDSMAVIEPGHILGDNSRKVNLQPNTEQQNQEAPYKPKSKQKVSTFTPQTKKSNKQATSRSRVGSDGYYSPSRTQNVSPENPSQFIEDKSSDNGMNSTQDNTSTTSYKEATVSPPIQSNKESSKNPVVGQVYINQLLVTLFPHHPDFGSKSKKLQ